jgi:hypothetical protein
MIDRLRLYICPHPKSLSLGERDFEWCFLSLLLPFSPREKGLGDEGKRVAEAEIAEIKNFPGWRWRP